MIFKKDEADETQLEDVNVATPPRPESEERPQKGKETKMAENGEVTVVGVGARLDGNVVSAGSLRIVNSMTSPGRSAQLSISVQ